MHDTNVPQYKCQADVLTSPCLTVKTAGFLRLAKACFDQLYVVFGIFNPYSTRIDLRRQNVTYI